MTLTKSCAIAVFSGLIICGLTLRAAPTTANQLEFVSQPTNTIVGASLGDVTVQLANQSGVAIAQSGVAVLMTMNKNGLGGTTNVLTDATGKAVFNSLKVSLAGSGNVLTASAAAYKSATSGNFTVSKGATATTLISSTNFVFYGGTVTFTATVSPLAPAASVPTGSVTFKDGSAALGVAPLNSASMAIFGTNRIFAATNQVITAVYSGDSNFSTSTSSNLLQASGKLALTISGIIASNKMYDATTNAVLNFTNATLATILPGDTVILNFAAAKGAFATPSAAAGKTVSVTGLTLTGASAPNYALTPPTLAASITPRSLVVTAKGVNKVYDGTSNAAVTLADNRLSGDVFTDGYTAAVFTNKNIEAAVAVNVSGLFITGTNAGNYVLSNLTATTVASITAAPLVVSGVIASNKVYDATTTAYLNFTNARLATIFGSDVVTLNPASAKGTFATKTVGAGKTVQVSGLTLSGTSATNYSLTQPATTASISPRSLTISAKGANQVYNGTSNAVVTLSDNHVSGDNVTDSFVSAFFANKNVATNILILVSGLAIAGSDATNYVLTATSSTTTANITKAPLTVTGLTANNKSYDRTTTATLNFSNASLASVYHGDVVTLYTNLVKAAFGAKNVGTNLTVTITGLAIGGASSNNYALTQPAAAASILPRGLTITATAAAKVYDGTSNAVVTLADNRITGDVLTNSCAGAAFAGKNPGTNLLVNVWGLAIIGPDATNYVLTATNITTATNISPAVLTVAAANLSRPYGTTNPVLLATWSGFVVGESLTNSDVTGAPALSTTATTNSSVGTFTITLLQGTLASFDYTFKCVNGRLTVTKANTAALLSTSLNPARTNQNITYAATVNPQSPTLLPVTGVIQFRCNGSNTLGGAIALSNGAANITVPAATLGRTNAIITAEYSDPAGNFYPSTNSLTQAILTVVTPPPPGRMWLTTGAGGGAVTGQILGTSGQTYVIQASTDLVNWIPLSTNLADTNGIVWLVDSNAVAFPKRFYRAYTPLAGEIQ